MKRNAFGQITSAGFAPAFHRPFLRYFAPVDGAAYLSPEAVTTTVPAISRLFRYPLPEVETLVAVRTAAGLHARPATQTGGFPVVVYSHGLFLYPEQNTALAMLCERSNATMSSA